MLDIEKNIYGKKWGRVHGGYFSDLQILKVYLDEVLKYLKLEKINVVGDLGGGTGFVLYSLLEHLGNTDIKLINIDSALEQLAQVDVDCIKVLHKSFNEFKRGDLCLDKECLMLIARSVLHYVGSNGLHPLLRHIGSQLECGEYFIHQTACFNKSCDADCLNEIYDMMKTGKWYPTVSTLISSLEVSGFEVESLIEVPSLPLKMEELSERYAIDLNDFKSRLNFWKEKYFDLNDVIVFSDKSFTAYLHYKIFICRKI